MLQFFEMIKEKRVQNQIEQQRQQELAQQRDMELIEVLKKREDPSVSREEALIAFSAWWEKWLPVFCNALLPRSRTGVRTDE